MGLEKHRGQMCGIDLHLNAVDSLLEIFGNGQVLNDMKHACSILVTSVPKNTKATLSLREPAEVLVFLHTSC